MKKKDLHPNKNILEQPQPHWQQRVSPHVKKHVISDDSIGATTTIGEMSKSELQLALHFAKLEIGCMQREMIDIFNIVDKYSGIN